MLDRHHRLAGTALLASLLLAACGSAAPSGSSPSGGASSNGPVRLRLAAGDQGVGYPTPFAAVRGPGVLLTTFMFDTLAFPDVTGQPKPWLASSWDTSADGKTWTFHIHPGARWQDGQPLTAEDVVFSFDYDLHGAGAATGVARGLNYVKSVSAPDAATVVVQLSAVHPSFLSDIGSPFGIAIIPKHIWASVTDPAHFQGQQALIGSGPYRLRSFDLTNNTFDFVANDDFYLGKPVVRELQLIHVGDALLALQRGELDEASAGNKPVPQSELDTLRGKFTMLTAPGEFNEALFFNTASGFPYDRAAFRQAVAYAINRKDMLNRLASGRGVPGSAGDLGPSNPFLDTNLPSYDYDPAKAAALLDQIGITSRNGVRTNPDGSPLTIPLLASASDSQQATLVREYLRAVGLTVQIVSVDQPTSDARDSAGDYKMAIVHFGGLAADPSQSLAQRFASTSTSKSFTHVFGYSNASFNRLAAEQATTLDPAKRHQLVNRMQEILAQDLPELPLYVPEQVAFANPSVFKAWAYTPGCPPCGPSMNKRMLVTGSAQPAPANSSSSGSAPASASASASATP